MASKKFFYGLGVGILSSMLYPKCKGKLRAAVVKTVQETLIACDAAKDFVNDIDEKAKEEREKRYKRFAKEIVEENITDKEISINTNEIKDSGNIKNEIYDLQKKLDELQSKLRSSN